MTITINNITNINILFLNRLAKILSLDVLALKLLKILIKINSPKKAVKKYLSFISVLKNE